MGLFESIPSEICCSVSRNKSVYLSSTIDPEDFVKAGKYKIVLEFISKPYHGDFE
jgi:hypothetical protein